MQLIFNWLSFEINLDDLSIWLQTTYGDTYDGITATTNHLKVNFVDTAPDTAQTDIQAHIDSLTQASEALSSALDTKNIDINNLRDVKLNSGFTWDGNVYDTNLVSKLNVTATVASLTAGAVLPSNFTWRSQDNQNIPMTSMQLSTFATAMASWAETIYMVSWYHKAQITALTTAAAVEAYDITVGWPTS